LDAMMESLCLPPGAEEELLAFVRQRHLARTAPATRSRSPRPAPGSRAGEPPAPVAEGGGLASGHSGPAGLSGASGFSGASVSAANSGCFAASARSASEESPGLSSVCPATSGSSVSSRASGPPSAPASASFSAHSPAALRHSKERQPFAQARPLRTPRPHRRTAPVRSEAPLLQAARSPDRPRRDAAPPSRPPRHGF
jgi:hypothetical protein